MDIDKISGHDFEDLVEKLIKQLGFITEERKRSADGGIDIRAINEQPIIKGLYIIQCKRYSNIISESIIRSVSFFHPNFCPFLFINIIRRRAKTSHTRKH